MNTALRLVLIARAAVSALFAWAIYSMMSPTFPDLLGELGLFLAVDGALALTLAVVATAARWSGGIAAIAVVDGILRIATALTIRFAPGIPFPVTMVLFMGLMAAFDAILGLFEILEAVRLARLFGRDAVSLTFWALGIATMLVGVLDFIGDPTPGTWQTKIAAVASLEALAFGALSVTSFRRHGSPVRSHAAG
jgi:hypothetical protein